MKAFNYKVAIYWSQGSQKLSIFNSHLKDERRALIWARSMASKYLGKYNTLYINDRRLPRGSDNIECYNHLGVRT